MCGQVDMTGLPREEIGVEHRKCLKMARLRQEIVDRKALEDEQLVRERVRGWMGVRVRLRGWMEE